VIAPDIWNPADYESGVRLYLGRSVVPSGVEWIRPTADAAAFTGAPLFASFGDGRLARLDPRELRSALARLSKIRVPYAGDHAGELPVVWLSIERPPSGG
jgi:hypothetical protein